MDEISVGRPSEPPFPYPPNVDVNLKDWMRDVERRLQQLESQAGTS